MAGFEDLIRNTLERHGDLSPERREAVYESSRQALERMLQRNDSLTPTAKETQRKRLEDAIAAIEAGYLTGSTPQSSAPATTTAAPLAPSEPIPAAPRSGPASNVSTTDPAQVRSSSPAHPQVAAGSQAPHTVARTQPQTHDPLEPTAPIAETVVPPPASSPHVAVEGGSEYESEQYDLQGPARLEDFPGIYSERTSRERRPFAKLLLWTIILAGFGVAVWWAINFGPALVQQQLGGAVPNPEQPIESGQFVPESEKGWVTAFNPVDDSANVVTGNRGTASLYQDDTSSFIRMASNRGGTDNNLQIIIPREVLIPFRGQGATIELLVKNSSDAPHQIAVFCEFGSMGSCGRKRFDARDRAEAQIFDVTLNDIDLAVNEDAFISINTDLEGEGRSIDLYAIRIRPSS